MRVGDGVLCEKCQIREGTISVSRVVQGLRTEVMLCGSCLRDEESYEMDTAFSTNYFISSIIDAVQSSGLKVEWIKTTACGQCGMTYGLFREMGRFGCASCYDAFRDRISEWISQYHGSSRHTGKRPVRQEQLLVLKAELLALQEALHLAVQGERYEEAAKIRDEIKVVEVSIHEFYQG